MKVIHVLRKPVSEGSVAKNVLKHGTGALNIDKSRIGTTDLVQKQAAHRGNPFTVENPDRPYTPREYRSDGRWPANLILQHLDGCRCEGVKKVKPSNGSGRAGPGSRGFQTSYVGGESKAKGFTGGSGKETVANWICVEGCPVKALDEQGGVRRSGSGGKMNGGFWRTLGEERVAASYSDTGGASRFFKQVKADEGD